MSKTLESRSNLVETTGVARFHLAFDEESYEDYKDTRIRDPEAFIVVKSVEFGGRFVDVKGSDKFINLKKISAYRMPLAIGSRLLKAVEKITTVDYDCYSFACDVMGALKAPQYPSGWEIDFDAEIPWKPTVAVRMFPAIEEPQGMYIADPSREHWFIPLHTERGGVALHVAGTERPLMVSPFNVINQIYPGKTLAVATPLVLG